MKNLKVTISGETNKAFLFCKKRKSGNVSYWLPKSKIKIYDKKDHNFTGQTFYYISLPDWLYDETFGSYKVKKNYKPRAIIYKGMNTNSM